MPRKRVFDKVLFVTVVLLSLLGLLVVYSASAVLASDQYGTPYHFLIRQTIALVIGLAGMAILMRANYRALAKPGLVYTLLGITALLLMASLASPAINGTHRWLKLGPMSLQPSELAKLSLLLFLAWRLHRDGEAADATTPPGTPRPPLSLQRTLAPCLVFAGFPILLVVLQPDLGTAVILSILTGSMLFIAGARMKHLVAIGVACLIALLLVVPMKGYQLKRVTAFLDPEADPMGAGYQVRQSTIAVGAGGPTGRGLGEGQQKLYFLPYPYTDFVFAVIGEELGMVGTLGVLAAFLVLLWRGARVAARAPDSFGRYLAAGITVFLVAQAMINMGVALGALPAKGLPLPFVSYGGSSLMAGLFASGLLLNVSQYSG